MKIGNRPSDQRQRLLPRAWIYDYTALTPFICIPHIQQCGLECATPPQKNSSPENSSQAVPNPLNAINPAFFCSFHFIVSLFRHFPAWGSLIDLAFKDGRQESWGARQSVWEHRINSDTDKWLGPDWMNYLTYGILQRFPLMRVASSCLFSCFIIRWQAHLFLSGAYHLAGANDK